MQTLRWFLTPFLTFALLGTCMPVLSTSDDGTAECPIYARYEITVMNLNSPSEVLERLEADCVVVLPKHQRYLLLEVRRLPKEDLDRPLSSKETFDYFYYPALEMPMSWTTSVKTVYLRNRDDQ